MIRNRACKRTIAEWLSRVVQILLMPVLACYFLVDFRVREEEFFGLFSATSHRFRHAGGSRREEGGMLGMLGGMLDGDNS